MFLVSAKAKGKRRARNSDSESESEESSVETSDSTEAEVTDYIHQDSSDDYSSAHPSQDEDIEDDQEGVPPAADAVQDVLLSSLINEFFLMLLTQDDFDIPPPEYPIDYDLDYNYEDMTEDDTASQGRDVEDGPTGHGHNIDDKATDRGRNTKGKSRSRNTKNKDAVHENKAISRGRNTNAKPTRCGRNGDETMGPAREDDTMNATHKDDAMDEATDAVHEDEDVRVDSDYHEPLGSEHVAEDNHDEPRPRQKVSSFSFLIGLCVTTYCADARNASSRSQGPPGGKGSLSLVDVTDREFIATYLRGQWERAGC